MAVVEFLQVEPQETQNCSFEAQAGAVLGTLGCEEGFGCHLMGKPKLQETCILSVITSVRVPAVIMLLVSNNASAVLKLLRYVGCDVM